VMPASRAASAKARDSAPRPIGPSPAWLGKSQRGFLWVVQNLRKPSRTGWGSGTIRSLLPLPMMRS